MRLWIEVDADGDEAVIARLVEVTCDALMVGLVEAEAVLDPAISVTTVGEAQEWIAPLS